VRTLRIRSMLATVPVILATGLALFGLFAAEKALAQDPPKYQVDPSWPKELPNNWIMGQVGGMAVDRQDHIWVLPHLGSATPRFGHAG
jgi:hypothetical protein